jgi:hypothetical protein
MDRVKILNSQKEKKRKENLILEKEHTKTGKRTSVLLSGQVLLPLSHSFSHTHTHTHTAVGIELCHPYFQAKLQIQNHPTPLHFPPKRIKLF